MHIYGEVNFGADATTKKGARLDCGVALWTTLQCPKFTPEVVAEATVIALRQTVLAAVLGIVFLSRGQSEEEEATLNINSTLKSWSGKKENVAKAQEVFLGRCNASLDATLWKYGGGAGGRLASSESLYVEGYKY
ncbi:Fructose-bisphosphate aldolase [Thalictrum thalictroides]|uniref:fructose-bisphosphate aldolase n=1 Tax=Thalictrum thalictroides TaxID=46969 RepID=A0A7J6VNS1_THATH|nr:Fructose-bisphosphate aldolase [Thalictrum thalictroides]